MRIGDWLCSRVFRRAGKVFTIAATLGLITMLCAATGRAGDLSAQPADNLNITNAATNVLPQGRLPQHQKNRGSAACISRVTAARPLACGRIRPT